MKFERLYGFIMASVVAVAGTVMTNSPARAQTTRFVCRISSLTGIPTTYAMTRRGAVPVIRWYSEYFSAGGFTPERRCQEVSARFQSLWNDGMLKYLIPGYINGFSVICATRTPSESCSSQGLLFTLKSGSDASAALQQLFGIRRVAASDPLYESSGGDFPVIDFEDFLRNSPTSASSTSNSSSSEDDFLWGEDSHRTPASAR